MNRPHYPIVYVRGYAMTEAAVEDTVADPYMGFNLGSTKTRQQYTREIVRHVFESPLVRLMKDEQYTDVYEDGAEIPEGKRPSDRAIWIYRYYEPVSKSLGTGKRPEIEDYARGLKELLDRMERQYCTRGGVLDAKLRDKFRVYLVAHSMGGLICRCLLQHVAPGDPRVDKVFTYATPHGGIDLRLIGNVPDFLRFNNSENFNEERMREYLALPKQAGVHSLDGKFPPERFFCLVGTNHRDYGLARLAVGPMSDGLVQIRNAYVDGAPRAFVHRAHSGHFGIVNSEEGYQNLRRFFFGNVRVDAFLDIREITLPPKLQKRHDQGREVHAPYHVEVVARVRGARWDLHRRTVGEASSVFVDYDARVRGGRPVQLASLFLSNAARVSTRRPSLGFSVDLGVQVPEYQVDGRWFGDDHYDGGYLFRDKLNFEAVPSPGAGWKLRYGFDSRTPNLTTDEAAAEKLPDRRYRFTLPIAQSTRPGIDATLRIETRPWNAD
jgi:pimeloyl-ACP methyl ester carboxylesterase